MNFGIGILVSPKAVREAVGTIGCMFVSMFVIFFVGILLLFPLAFWSLSPLITLGLYVAIIVPLVIAYRREAARRRREREVKEAAAAAKEAAKLERRIARREETAAETAARVASSAGHAVGAAGELTGRGIGRVSVAAWKRAKATPAKRRARKAARQASDIDRLTELRAKDGPRDSNTT